MNFNFISIGSLINSNEASLQTGPFGTQLKASEYVEFGTPVINVRNIGFGDIRADNLEYITDFKAEQLKNHLLCKGDIVFGRKGAVERHSYIQDEQVGWVQGSDCLRLRLNTQKVDSRFLSYYFKTQPHQDWMHALCAFGATMASLNQDIVRRILFPCPSISVQRKIVAILSAYDDLIENNKKRIQILENMAEELYKEWFVRFRFPNYENTEFEKGLPSDWSHIKLSDILELKSGYAFKSSIYKKEGTYGLLTIKNVHSKRLKQSYTDYIVESENNSPEYCALKRSDILMSLTGNVGRVCRFYGKPALLNQRVCKIVVKNKYFESFIYEYFQQEHILAEIDILATGTAQQNLSPNDLKKMRVLFPEDSILQKFHSIINPAHKEILLLLEQNMQLIELRDSLLPKLISGKLSVENLDLQFPPSMQEQ